MEFKVELKTQTEIDLWATYMRNLLGLREGVVKEQTDSPLSNGSAATSANREDKGGPKKPPKSVSAPSKTEVSALLKTKLEINQDSVAKALREFSTDSVAKFSTVPTENYKALIKVLEAIK